MPPSPFTPNQCVAWNLERVRKMRDMTQVKAAEALEPYLGERWSKAVFSAAERSVAGTRVRQFTPDDLLAFSRAFDVPMTVFLMPPPWVAEVGHANGGTTTTRLELLDAILDMPEDARTYMVGKSGRPGEILELSAPTTRMLRRCGANFAELVAERERQLEVAGLEVAEVAS
jgi:hypothetical protein